MIYSNKEVEKAELNDQIDLVIDWLETELGTKVKFGTDCSDTYFYPENFITINTRQNLRSQFHALLHESGHAVIRNEELSYYNRFPALDSKRENKDFRIDVVREEVLAWEEGRILAENLDIKLNEEWWNRHYHKAVYEYIRYVICPQEHDVWLNES